MLSYSSYVQWVPGSDVIVAQNRNQLSVWYNLDDLERVSHISVKGDVINIERKTGKTEIIVQEGSSNVGYKLDEELIEFGTAIDDGDLNRALDYLESLPKEHQGADAMWKSLAKIAMEKEIDIYVKVKRWDDAIRVTERLVSKILVQREHMRFFKCIRRRSFSCEGT